MANKMIKSLFVKNKTIELKNGAGEFNVLEVSMPFDSFVEEMKQFVTEKGWVNLTIAENRVPTKTGGYTHHAKVWVKDGANSAQSMNEADNDLPF
jgi:hypothetical protein